ncbi:MAG: hypothetical protein ABI481_13310 [Pyrinomonadaceae bacterium]
MKFVPFAIVALVAVLGCGRFGRQANNTTDPRSASDQPSRAFTLAGKEWKTFELDHTDIMVDLPGPPSDKTPPPTKLPDGIQNIFSSMRVHAYDDKDFGSSYSQLEPTGKNKFDIKGLADTSMTAIKRQAPDLNYTLEIKSPTNAKYDGTFTRNGKSYQLKGCCIFQKTNPSRVWAVITVYPKDNADGRTASQRIIESVAFKNSSEECK